MNSIPMAPVTPGDLVTAVTGAFEGMDTAILGLAGVGLGLTLVIWGTPKAIAFVKRFAK